MGWPHQLLGISAAVLSFATCPAYVLSILRGHTKPDRVSWWILGAVSVGIAFSYRAVGAAETLWLPVEYALSFLLIAILSLWYGDGPARLHPLDRMCLAGAVLSGFVWLLLRSPLAGLTACIATDFIGLIPTFAKARARPWTEDRVVWIIATAASGLNVLALRSFAFSLSAYPIYVFVLSAVITGYIVRADLRRLLQLPGRA